MRELKWGLVRAAAIAPVHWYVPVRVPLHPYMRFSRRLDGQLQRLVARWVHASAPNAQGSRRLR